MSLENLLDAFVLSLLVGLILAFLRRVHVGWKIALGLLCVGVLSLRVGMAIGKNTPRLTVLEPQEGTVVAADCRGDGEDAQCYFRVAGEALSVNITPEVMGFVLINTRDKDGLCLSPKPLQFYYTRQDGKGGTGTLWYADVLVTNDWEIVEGDKLDVHVVLTRDLPVPGRAGECDIESIERGLGINILGDCHVVVQDLIYSRKVKRGT